ncbi:MAG: LLM class flavin-dependent oxidoreductase [Actinomycetota bacterium]
MRFGLALPHYDFSLPDRRSITFEALREWAVRAERLGFDSVWISDHFFLSLARYGGKDEPFGSLEPLTALAALAGATERVRLGTLVLCAPFRHPALLAKAATTIDLASDGRFDLGIGSGWYADEFARFGLPFGAVGERFAILEEQLEVLGPLLAGGPVDHEGPRYPMQGALNRPEPAQRPRPPIWVGGKGGPRLLRAIARYADGWNAVWRWSPDAYADKLRDLERVCEEVDRDPATVRRSVGLYTIVGEDHADLERRIEHLRTWSPGLDTTAREELSTHYLVGTPEQVRERIATFDDLGVEELILTPAQIPFAIPDADMLELIAEKVVGPLGASGERSDQRR